MKRCGSLGVFILGVSVAFLETCLAETRYVSLSGGHVPPFTSRATAATNIQAAINVSTAGDTVLVAQGVYASGRTIVSGRLANRLAITNAITVQSEFGSTWTGIQGGGPSGNDAVRCVYMANNAVLIGFTLFGGCTRTDGDDEKDRSGGGIWSESVNTVISNCVLINNSADYTGGGAFRGTFYDCTLSYNSALKYGGGMIDSRLYHCTLMNNYAGDSGGGAVGGQLRNCTLKRNVAESLWWRNSGKRIIQLFLTSNSVFGAGGGAFRSTLYNCTLTGNTAIFGGGTYDSIHHNCIIFITWHFTAPIG